MRHQKILDINLAAPCGFYCGTCRQYLAKAKGLLKKADTGMSWLPDTG
jgi:hypothetical protein